MRYICPLCGEVYDEELADVPFADLPEGWACPLCYAPRNSFTPEEPPAAAPETAAPRETR